MSFVRFARYLSKEEEEEEEGEEKREREHIFLSSTSKNQTRKKKKAHRHTASLQKKTACIRLFDERNRISFTLTRLRFLSSLHTFPNCSFHFCFFPCLPRTRTGMLEN